MSRRARSLPAAQEVLHPREGLPGPLARAPGEAVHEDDAEDVGRGDGLAPRTQRTPPASAQRRHRSQRAWYCVIRTHAHIRRRGIAIATHHAAMTQTTRIAPGAPAHAAPRAAHGLTVTWPAPAPWASRAASPLHTPARALGAPTGRGGWPTASLAAATGPWRVTHAYIGHGRVAGLRDGMAWICNVPAM